MITQSKSNQVVMSARIAVDDIDSKTFVNSVSGTKDTISMSGSIEKTVIQGEA